MSASPFAFLRRWNLQASIRGLCANRKGDWFAIALANGALVLMPTDDAGEDPLLLQAHEGTVTSLSPDADDHAFLSGGVDGRLLLAEPALSAPTELIKVEKGRLSALAVSGSGYRAFAVWQHLYLLDPEGQLVGTPADLGSPLSAMAFTPNHDRLVVAQGQRLSLFDPAHFPTPLQTAEVPAPIGFLVWHGSTLLTAPGGATKGPIQSWALNETGLASHDKALPLPEPATGLALTAKGRFLAVSAGKQILCYALSGSGLEEKAPLCLGAPETQAISCLAPNPSDDVVAIGYTDGAVLLAPLDGRKELMLFPPVAPAGAGVVGLVWNKQGDCLHAALENGHVFLFTLKSVSRFIQSQTR